MPFFSLKKYKKQDNIKHAVGLEPMGLEPCFISRNNYSEVVLLSILNKITSGLRAATWSVVSNNSPLDAERLRVFLNENTINIYRKLFFDGYARITRSSNGFVLLDKKDKSLFWLQIETSEYKERQKSLYKILIPYLKSLDTKLNADCSITENLGALGILAPKDSSGMSNLDEDEVKHLQNDWAKLYGITNKKWSMLITQRAVEYQPIKLPINELNLGSSVEMIIKIICGFIGVPYELYPLSGQSTYANRKEAFKELYNYNIPNILNLIYDEIRSPLRLEGFTITWQLPKINTDE